MSTTVTRHSCPPAATAAAAAAAAGGGDGGGGVGSSFFFIPRLASAVARRVRESEPLVFICSGACASALRFKRASAAELHYHYTWRSRFPVNRL